MVAYAEIGRSFLQPPILIGIPNSPLMNWIHAYSPLALLLAAAPRAKACLSKENQHMHDFLASSTFDILYPAINKHPACGSFSDAPLSSANFSKHGRSIFYG